MGDRDRAVMPQCPTQLWAPIASVPAFLMDRGGNPMIIDFATPVVAAGKVQVAQVAGIQLPSGAILNRFSYGHRCLYHMLEDNLNDVAR